MTTGKNKQLQIWLLLIISAGLLTVIQPPFGWSFLAWVAYVPFILASTTSHEPRAVSHQSPVTGHGKMLFLAAYFVSFFYWLGNLYWLIPVTTAGWFTMCLYLAILWPILAVALRFCAAKKIPLLLSVPVLFVGAERLQGFFFGGFFWRYLSHSQYDNLIFIQIADIFGAAGVSFLIAMVNALVAEFIVNFKFQISNSKFLFRTALVSGLVLATILYGRWRIDQFDKVTEQGPLVGSVQSCVPQSVKQSAAESNDVAIETFNKMAVDSNSVADAGAVLSIWPETMVPAYLDDRLLGLLADTSMHKYFHKRLCAVAKDRSYILVGATSLTPKINDDYTIEPAEKYNSAFLYKPAGRQSIEQYNKIHLVPFGEYVPFKKSIPLLHKMLMKFTPYDYDYTLDAGDEFTIFRINAGGEKAKKTYRFGVMICYEDSVPKIARGFVLNKAGQKQVDWLINISNDGWFVNFIDGRAEPTTELAQHAAVCVFRAVENRVPVIRSVNTGISCIVDSSGKIRDGFLAGTLPGKALERKGMAGWFVDKMTIDKRVTFFGRYGQWLDNFCAFFLGLVIAAAITTSLISKPQANKRSSK